MEKVEFRCQALGSPNPKYTWVDKEGIDATEKEGEISTLLQMFTQVFFKVGYQMKLPEALQHSSQKEKMQGNTLVQQKIMLEDWKQQLILT